MEIKITEEEKTSNIVFQVKQLLITLIQYKPQVEQALRTISAIDGLSEEMADKLNIAFNENKSEFIKKLKKIEDAL